MATTASGNTPTCVSWLLLTSYALLLGVGGLGVWVSAINFGYEEALPPIPPPKNTTITTTITTTTRAPGWLYQSRVSHRNLVEVPQAYKDYVSASIVFARACSDVRFYLVPLCLICVVVACLTLVASLFSRQFFNSTFSLYSSFGLWVLSLVMTIVYQSDLTWEKFPFDLHKGGWVLGFHVLLLLFLSVQMLLCVWELRRQKTNSWPTINILNVFTIEGFLLAPRLILTFFTIMALCDSQVLLGFAGKQDPLYRDSYYELPHIRYPLKFSFLFFFAAFYNAVATLETMFSLLLGKLHHQMTTLTCQLSGLCCMIVAILISPAFVRTFIGPYTINSMTWSTMNLAISLSVVTLFHWLACLFFPSTLRTPLHLFAPIFDRFMQATFLDDISAVTKVQGIKRMELSSKNKNDDFNIKAISLIFSSISIVIVGISLGYSGFPQFGLILVLLANTVTVLRTLPPLVMKTLHGEQKSITAKQNLSWLAFEVPCLLVGSIGICITVQGLGLFAGVSNILFAAFQGAVMLCQLKEKVSHDLHSADTKHLILAEEVTTQEDDKKNPIDAMA